MASVKVRSLMLFSFLIVLLLVNAVHAQPVSFPVSVDQSFLGAGSDETSAWSPCPFGSLCPRDGETWGTDAPIELSAIGISEGDQTISVRISAVLMPIV